MAGGPGAELGDPGDGNSGDASLAGVELCEDSYLREASLAGDAGDAGDSSGDASGVEVEGGCEVEGD